MSAVLPRAKTNAPSQEYDQTPLFVIGIFCAYIITWFMQLGDRIAILGTIRLEFLLAISLIGLSFVTKRQRLPVKTNLPTYLVLFFIALMIEIPFSYDFDMSWTTFVDRVVKFAFMAVFIATFVRSPTALKFFIAALMLAWFKLGQEGLLGEITGSKVWENQGVMRLHGPTGMYGHPNSYSGFGLGLLPFIYYLWPVARKWWQKAFLLVMLVFAINIILNTGSRTGYIGFLAFLVLAVLRSKYKLKLLIALALLSVVAVPYIPQQYVERFQSISGKEKEGNSKGVRIVILKDAATIFAEHPFGIGISAFPAIRAQRFGRTQDTHNLYMEVLTNLGIQGFLVWALLLVALFRNTSRLLKEIGTQLVRLPQPRAPAEGEEAGADELQNTRLIKHIYDLKLMQGMLLAVSTYVLLRLVVGFFGMDLYEIYWWFALGIVLAVHSMAQVAGRITNDIVAKSGATSPAAEPQKKAPPGAGRQPRKPALSAPRTRLPGAT